jgi:prepilin-type N-terminal cleavage/methylation domain-containing protein
MSRCEPCGFSMVELAIVLVIFGLIIDSVSR